MNLAPTNALQIVQLAIDGLGLFTTAAEDLAPRWFELADGVRQRPTRPSLMVAQEQNQELKRRLDELAVTKELLDQENLKLAIRAELYRYLLEILLKRVWEQSPEQNRTRLTVLR